MHESDQWTVSNFIQTNPAGPTQGDVAALLRRVADSVEELGDVDVQDIAFHPETGLSGVADEPAQARISMTVYYHRRTVEG